MYKNIHLGNRRRIGGGNSSGSAQPIKDVAHQRFVHTIRVNQHREYKLDGNFALKMTGALPDLSCVVQILVLFR